MFKRGPRRSFVCSRWPSHHSPSRSLGARALRSTLLPALPALLLALLPLVCRPAAGYPSWLVRARQPSPPAGGMRGDDAEARMWVESWGPAQQQSRPGMGGVQSGLCRLGRSGRICLARPGCRALPPAAAVCSPIASGPARTQTLRLPPHIAPCRSRPASCGAPGRAEALIGLGQRCGRRPRRAQQRPNSPRKLGAAPPPPRRICHPRRGV